MFRESLKRVALCVLVVGAPLPAVAQVGEYQLEVLATYSNTLFANGVSERGHMAGSIVLSGMETAFVVSPEQGFQLLPMPPGYDKARANDVNSAGVVVGTATSGISPYDDGDPVVWIPDGNGGYVGQALRPLATTTALGGTVPIKGGMASCINDRGDIVGFSRIQGFLGGPSTVFFIDDAIDPIDLSDPLIGFAATVEDLSDNGTITGGSYKMSLNDFQPVQLGTPGPVGGVHINFVIGYAINDSGMVVAAGRRATSTADRWLTFLHDGIAWSSVDPTELPYPNVGFYDVNNLGDIVFRGGILFGPENLRVQNANDLLEPGFEDWNVRWGFINNDRTMLTTAINQVTGENAIVRLTPMYSGPPTVAESSKLLDGTIAFGALADVMESDNVYLGLDPSPTQNPYKQKVDLILSGESYTASPSSIEFHLESAMTGGPDGDVLQTIRLWDGMIRRWVTIDRRTLGTEDSTVVVPGGDPGRFVHPTTGEVLAKITWETPDFVGPSFFWSVDVDKAIWRIE